MKIESVAIASLKNDPENARIHSEKNLEAITGSLKEFGQRKPIVVYGDIVVAGNGTIEAAKKLDWKKIEITRVPSEWSYDQARAFALADNRSAELAEWDIPLLTEQLLDLDAVGFDISEFGFMELEPPSFQTGDDVENPYTGKTSAPQYEIVGEEPATRQLFDKSKTQELINSINKLEEVDPETKEFLLLAATRHVVFNYAKIAEFYPHATLEIQKLMEESALVIIDFDDAMKNGYTKIQATIEDIKEEDRYGSL